jgi:hypothetical protein
VGEPAHVTLGDMLAEIVDKDERVNSYPWGSALIRLVRNNDGYKLGSNPDFHTFYDWLQGLDFSLMNFVVRSQYRPDLDMFINEEPINPFRDDRTNYENVVEGSVAVAMTTVIGFIVDASMQMHNLTYKELDTTWVVAFCTELARLIW